jgi:hypothetical protein
MSKRGRILRDPSFGPGLVLVDGRQYPFPLERVWKSEVPPRPGLVVVVDFDPPGQVSAMSAVPEPRFGPGWLIAATMLLAGWFALGAVGIDAGVLGRQQFTLWQLLALMNAGPAQLIAERPGSGTGLYGALAIACLAGPLLAQFWRDARAHLAGLLPLAFLLLMAPLAGYSLAGSGALQVVSLGAGAGVAVLATLYFAACGVRHFLARRAAEKP